MAGFKVKAVYEYTSEEPDDLRFPIGQVITITEEIDADWYEGEYTDAAGVKQSGIFPNNFVEKYEPEVPLRPSRPTRPKQDAQPAAAPISATREPEPETQLEPQNVSREEDDTPPVPAASKPQPPPVIIPAEPPKAQEEVRSPPSAISERSPIARTEPVPAPNPTPSEPASAESRKPPPPVAPKSNAFKDRIAAFNQPAAAPVLPFQPQGHKSQPSFIKKPFVAPPPSSSAYVPPPTKQEPQPTPYRREEDPEIKQRQEDDRAAAEAAGFGEDAQAQQEEDDEDAPKPQSLKERIALLQKQQAEQAQRRAGGGEKKEKKPPARKPSEPLPEDDNDELERVRSPGDERQSLDVSRDRPRVPSTQRRPQEPMSPLPDAPQHEILSGGEEADQSAAGETTEDDAGTIGPDDSDAKPLPPRRASTAPKAEADLSDEQDTTEDAEEEEDSMDEETRRREELRQRMAKMSGGMGMAGMFGPPGGMPTPGKSAPKKRTSTKDSNRQASGDTQSPTSPTVGEQQRMPMMPIPGMQRMQSPHSEEPRRSVEKEREPEAYPISGQRQPDVVPDVEDVKPEPLPRASLTEERGAPPPVPRGERDRKSSRTQRPTQTSYNHCSTEVGSPRSSTAGNVRRTIMRESKRPLSQAAPPVPGDFARPPPGPPPLESRPVPPPPPPTAAPAMPLSPGPGSESDDEASVRHLSAQTPTSEAPLPIRTGAPPVPIQREAPPQPKRASYFGTAESAPHTAPADKRSSRVPPIPGSSPPLVSPRPPPPPPPQASAPPSRQSTDLQAASSYDDDDRRESDYEGDYDTDIASSAKHKDALKSHTRDDSYDGSTTADDTPVTSPGYNAPQPPVHRAVPPPPPQAAPRSRPSMDTPRAPPPAPPQRDMSVDSYGGDYDPYRYNEASKPPPPVPGAIPISAPPIPPREAEYTKDDSSDDMYSASPPRKSMDRPPPPPPTQPEQQAPMPPMPPMPPVSQPSLPPRAPPRQSLDVQRTPTMGRRSMDQSRPLGDNGQIAGDINLSQETAWWTAAQPLPPVLQNRRGVDILSESEESKTSKRGGRTTISKDIYVLYIDYSQTIITARYDPQEPEVVSLEQRHEAPPPKLRQDQLETYWQRFGAKIGDTAASLGNSKKDTTVGDGTPFALISDLIKAQPEALHPVGTRAFGALVYANLANASVMQFDEIRAGDIVTLRNAKFEGKHSGPMHQKYKQDLGAGHVAIVAEWDGTRKKVRAWEQGREKAKVRMESFRLGDLKSGEVRVWRVVGREWVGWEGEA